MPRIKAKGAEFYYELHGIGQPLILIAGYTCDHTFWIPVLDNLSKHYQVLIFDNRGVGQTTDDHKPLSVDLMADDVVALSQQLNLDRPHIVGHSMGGNIAQSLGVRYPEKISKLGILSSSSKWRETMLLACDSLLQMRKDNISFNLIIEAEMPWFFGEEFLQSQESVKLVKHAMFNNEYPQTLEDQFRQFNVLRTFDGRQQLKNIRSQTLVINGIQDLITLPSESEFLASQIPGAKRMELNCAHSMTLEMPKPLSEALINFL